MFKPWIGKEFDRTGLLILGESAYSWYEDDELWVPGSDHSCTSVDAAIDDFASSGIFFKAISRALANNEAPSKERLQFVWDRVAFTNYVSKSVGVGPRVRPTSEMWETAKSEFRDDLSKIAPRRVIVLGKVMWGKMPDANVTFTDDVQGYCIGDGKLVMCHALNHPTHGLSWRELASVIHFAYAEELRSE